MCLEFSHQLEKPRNYQIIQNNAQGYQNRDRQVPKILRMPTTAIRDNLSWKVEESEVIIEAVAMNVALSILQTGIIVG